MTQPTLSRRAFLRRAAPAVVVGAATPLWAKWLADEMRKLAGRKFWIPPRHVVGVDVGEADSITTITLSIDGKTYTVDPGGVQYTWEKAAVDAKALTATARWSIALAGNWENADV